jgi:uncharacterized protein (TIGR02145 family)
MFLLLVSCGDNNKHNSESVITKITGINPNSGDIGDLITITGKNFGKTKGTSFVLFNSIKVVDYIKWSDTKIQLQIPIGATTGKLSVTENNQKSIGINFKVNNNNEYDNMTDIDGNVYNAIKIGTQIWMAKNLNVSHYRNGDEIPQVTDLAVWGKIKTGAWCYYNNDPVIGKIYGKLYNWHAVNDSRGLAPKGWHIATDEEWSTLTNYLGGIDIAGGKLKEAGTEHWLSPNTGARNESGFTALPGGFRTDYGAFGFKGTEGYWWSTKELRANGAWGRLLQYDDSNLRRGSLKDHGFSVRCIRD